MYQPLGESQQVSGLSLGRPEGETPASVGHGLGSPLYRVDHDLLRAAMSCQTGDRAKFVDGKCRAVKAWAIGGDSFLQYECV